MKFGFLKFGFFKVIPAIVIAIGLLAGDGFCQDMDIFSGRGIGSSLQNELQQAGQNQKLIPSIKNFSSNDVPSTGNPFSGLFKKPKLPTWEGFKQKPIGDFLGRSNPLGDAIGNPVGQAIGNPLGNLFPKREASRPNFFQMMNSKSKDFWGKTASWAKGKGGGLREKPTATWDNVIRDFKENEAKHRQQATIPAQPKFRTAEALGEPKLRF